MKRLLLCLITLVGFAIGAVSFTGTADAQVTAENFEVMLVVDTSGSMEGQAIDQTKAAAVGFINQMPPNVRIGLVSFGETVSAPPSHHGPSAADPADHRPGGRRRARSSTTASWRRSTPTRRPRTHKALVVLSDGKDSGSANTLEAAVAAVQGHHVETISLRPRPRPTSRRFRPSVRSPRPTTRRALSAAFARVADLLTKVVEPPPAPVPAAAPVVATTVPAPVPTTAAPSVPTTAAATVPTTVYGRPPVPAAALAPSDSSFPWVPALAVFGSLVALVLLVWPRQRVSRARLGIQQPKTVSDMGQRTMSLFEEMAPAG